MIAKNICHLLILTLTFGPALARAEEKSTTTSALEGVASVLGTVGSGLGALQFSQQQMQGLVNQFGALQTQTNAGNAAQSQFDLVRQQLSVALAEASQCVEKAKKDTSKYKKGTLKPAEIDAIEPTCKTYGTLIDSIRKNLDQIYEVNTKMSCMNNLQNKMNQIADSAKKPFGDLTQSANDVWNTRKGIIDTHEGIVTRLDKELNDADNGFKTKLGKLKELEIKIRNSINAGASKEGGSGIGQRLKELKRGRVAAANSWYYDLMGDVESCFASDGTQACAFGTAASPADCIRAYVSETPKGTASERAQAKANAGKLDNAFRLNTGIIKREDTMANIDVSNPNGFLAHVNKRFNDKLAAISATFTKLNVIGNNVNKTQLRAFVQQKYRDCYESAVKRFQADMSSEGGRYKQAVNGVADLESSLNNDIKNLIEETQQSMTGFRTQFNKIYDRDLSQFSSDCTAGTDPYSSADCLRKLQVTLKGGIEGTKQTTTLQDGSQTVFTPGPTTLNLQTLALDQSGRATLQNSQTQCVGFEECLNVMDRYQAHHSEQAESQKKQREAFVEQHNKTVNAAMTGVAAQFTEVSKMIVAGVKGVNEDLTKAGVSASILTKQVEGETLALNEKTGLYDMPKNMKAALAGNGTYSEVGETSEATTGVNARISELNKKSIEAAKMKASCIIKKEEYSALADSLGDSCTEEKVCGSDMTTQVMGPLESLMKRGRNVPNTDKDSPITDRFEACMTRAEAQSSSSGLTSQDLAEITAGVNEADKKNIRDQKLLLRESEKKAKEGKGAKACSRAASAKLMSENAQVRTDDMKSTNQKIINALRRVTDSCPQDAAAAVEACEQVKKALRSASPPENEGETKVDTGAASGTTFSNPLRGGSTDAK